MVRLWGTLGWLALALGCDPVPATQVIVELRAEPSLLAQAQTLRVRVHGQDGSLVMEREKSITPAEGALARIPLIPRGDDPSRRFGVAAELVDATGAVLARIDAKAGYTESELRVLELWFEDACAGKLDCGAGRTCDAGSCVGACFSPRPSDQSGRSRPQCSECDSCDAACVAVDGIACGCPGETCSAGACQPAVRVRSVDAGSRHTCAVIDNGDVRCWGATTFGGDLGDAKGLLGTGDGGTDSATPVPVAGIRGRGGITLSGALTCTIDTQRACWGLNFASELGGAPTSIVSEPFVFDDPFELEQISSGFRHVCGVSAAAELWCWGYNERGNLGLGHVDAEVGTPTLIRSGVVQSAAAGDHTCVVDLEGKLWCWGYNDSGEVGVPGEQIVTTPVRPGCEPMNAGNACFDDWKEVGGGAFHSCGIRSSGELYCWGGNFNGQLGLGPPTSSYQVREPARVASDARFSDIDGGRSFSCALDLEGALHCWGLNEDRQLGIPDIDFIGVPTKLDVNAPGGWRGMGLGDYHACAIRADSTLWCWGRNSDGQVGLGTTTPEPIARPSRVCF